MKKIWKRAASLAAAAALALGMAMNMTAVDVYGAVGSTFSHYKTGVQMQYIELADGSAALTYVSPTRIADGSTATSITVPADVTYFEKWETVFPYGVTAIKANAFQGCGNVTGVFIEGTVTLEQGALTGLPDNVQFTTGSEATKQALIRYGIPAAQVTYTPVDTKYVAFGDSIAAGYALPEYDAYDTKITPDLSSDGDKFPTPADAFVAQVGVQLAADGSTVVVDNQAVSGWTSGDFLAVLQSGGFDAALKDADVVTVTIGSNDLLGPFIWSVKDALEQAFHGDSDMPTVTVDEDEGVVLQLKDTTAGNQGTTDDQTRLDNLVANLDEAIEILEKGLQEGGAYYNTLMANCETFKTINQPVILAELQKRAPGAEIYWTTLYNPFAGARLDIKTLFTGLEKNVDADIWNNVNVLDLDKYGATYIQHMNQAFDVNTGGYHRVELYDAFKGGGMTNVILYRDTKGTGRLWDDELFINFDPHPNAAGHAEIARLVNSVISSTYPAGTGGSGPADSCSDSRLDQVPKVGDGGTPRAAFPAALTAAALGMAAFRGQRRKRHPAGDTG